MTTEDTPKRPLTGRDVLIMLIVFFGVTIAVNGYFLFSAIHSFRGEDVKGSYRQGLEYNEVIEARNAQENLNWAVSANFVIRGANSGRLIVQLKDGNDAPLEGLQLAGLLRHPTDLAQDIEVDFEEEAPGLYAAKTVIFKGSRRLAGVATKDGGEPFRFRFDLQPGT